MEDLYQFWKDLASTYVLHPHTWIMSLILDEG